MTEKTLTVDGRTYRVADLPLGAQAHFQSLEAVDQHLARLQQRQAILLTARQSYLIALEAALAAEKAASTPATPERAIRRRKKVVVA